MKYRADIDGLRAIAILFVLFFHAGLRIFPSGFIGVDVFFVISGYLITSIIHDSLQNNHFSFIDFYNRRLWRLQPVFVCLLFCTLLLTLVFYLPEDLIHYFKSARKTSLFLSNSYFEKISTGYFSPDNNQLPLLHTWSLAIEWQCYLILPIVLYFLYRIFDKRHIPMIIFFITLIFCALTLYFSLKYPTKTYYHLSSRIFEFLIGACTVFSTNRYSLKKYFLLLIQSLALCSLFYIACSTNISTGFPNIYAFILCTATAILIVSGKHSNRTLITQMLSFKPVVFIGLISYSLYIWHWPVLVFVRYLEINETNAVILSAFGLIFILAIFSWRYIERPARQFSNIKFQYSLIFLLILPIALIHIGDRLIKKNEGYPQRFDETIRINAQLKKYSHPQRPLCLQEKNTEIGTDCVLGAKNQGTKTGFMFGDSHANHLWGFMDTLAQKANLSIVSHATAACLSLPGLPQYDWNNQIYTACQDQTERYYTMIRMNHYDFVILGQNWEGYMSGKLIPNEPETLVKKRIEKALDEAVQIILASGAKPVLIKAVAPSNAYHCFLKHIKQRKRYDSKECSFDMTVTKSLWQDELFLNLQHKYGQLIVIDPRQVQCPKNKCSADINGIPMFRDSGHLTDYASYKLAASYLKQYENPFKV